MMKPVIVVCLFGVLLVAFSEANFYGKRAMDGKSLRELISDMRAQQGQMEPTAEDVLAEIDSIIRQYYTLRSAPTKKRSVEVPAQ